MKTKQPLAAYEAPKIEVIVVEVEKGFAASVDDWGKGGHLGDHEAE